MSISFVVNLFNQRKHKRFNYVPRHLRDSKEDLKSQWNTVRNESQHTSKSNNRLGVLLIVLGMIIAVWLLLEHYEIS